MSQGTVEGYVTCLQAAEILDVSVSTVKRMCDQQLLDSGRTSGGHRRISMQSISRWITLQRNQTDSQARKFCQSALDPGSAAELLSSNSTEQLVAFLIYLRAEGHDLIEIVDTVFLPALRHCEALCQRGEIPRYRFHQCAANLASLMGYLHLKSTPLDADAPVAVGACVGPARSDLISSSIRFCLHNTGCVGVSLGSRVASGDLAQAAHDYQASVVWMNCSYVSNVDDVVEMTRALSERLSPSQLVILTGCGSWGVNRRQLQCDLAAESLRELCEFVSQRIACRTPAPIAGPSFATASVA
jgi:excisionase family DNA binding protein